MSAADPKVRSLAELLLCFVGPTVWTAHFMVMYGANALICAGAGQSPRVGLFPAIAAATTAVALLGLAGFVGWRLTSSRAEGRMQAGADHSMFSREISIVLAALSMLGTAWVALPALLIAPCASWST